jgi:hypothetical protein
LDSTATLGLFFVKLLVAKKRDLAPFNAPTRLKQLLAHTRQLTFTSRNLSVDQFDDAFALCEKFDPL